ncbi:MAG: sigma-70 family RNA polymerase sigma factor [Phycisphaerales bacterium JB059]
MGEDVPALVTRVLRRVRDGDDAAREELFSLVYEELRSMAAGQMRGQVPSHTLQATALVNEAYLRMGESASGLNDRTHFFAVAAKAMRQILIDHARRKGAAKRGGGEWDRVTLAGVSGEEREIDLVELDEALTELAALDERQSRIVELRFFGGLSIAQTAEVTEISTATIEREWRAARAWLAGRISEGGL